jgi:hypothetical protein
MGEAKKSAVGGSQDWESRQLAYHQEHWYDLFTPEVIKYGNRC